MKKYYRLFLIMSLSDVAECCLSFAVVKSGSWHYEDKDNTVRLESLMAKVIQPLLRMITLYNTEVIKLAAYVYQLNQGRKWIYSCRQI